VIGDTASPNTTVTGQAGGLLGCDGFAVLKGLVEG
jgi:hypothetical protein